MTRREALATLAVLFALFTVGLTWQFGPLALSICALLGVAAVLFGVQQVEVPHRTTAPIRDTEQEGQTLPWPTL